jgi:hypothetical protein
VLNQTLTSRQIQVISLWAAVPHYLSNQAYPPGVEALLRKAAEIVGFTLETDDLTERSDEFRSNVDAAVHESDELADYVHQLETEGMEEGEDGEDLVEEIERYLRDT